MTTNDFSRSAFPPQGWMFRQPQTGWTNPNAMVGFKASVDAIRKHRLANPAITAKHALSTDPEDIGNELEKYTRQRLGIPLVQETFFSPARSRLPERVVAAAGTIKTAARGTAVIIDWLTSGGSPVAQEVANQRASVCADCSKNIEGSWYTVAPAELIRSTLSARSDLKLQTPYDDRLKSCDICKCLNRLKPWVPLHHILKGTPPDIMAKFPDWCWIKKESKALTQPTASL